jgi:hypothetical protein
MKYSCVLLHTLAFISQLIRLKSIWFVVPMAMVDGNVASDRSNHHLSFSCWTYSLKMSQARPL